MCFAEENLNFGKKTFKYSFKSGCSALSCAMVCKDYDVKHVVPPTS